MCAIFSPSFITFREDNMKTQGLMIAAVAAIFTFGSISAVSSQTILFTGFQKGGDGKVWFVMKHNTIDPAAFRGHHLKMRQGDRLFTVKVVDTPYCVSKKAAVFKLKEAGHSSYNQMVYFGKHHYCVTTKK